MCITNTISFRLFDRNLRQLLVLRRQLADQLTRLSESRRTRLRAQIAELAAATVIPSRTPHVRTAAPPWPVTTGLAPWLLWLAQARADRRAPGGWCPGYSEAYEAARAYAGALKRMIALELDPWYPGLSRPDTLPFMQLKRLRRWHKGEGLDVAALDALIRTKRAARKAPIPGAKPRIPAEESRWQKEQERRRRERSRIALHSSVDRDERGVAILPPWPEDGVTLGYLDWVSAVVVDLYYALEEHEEAVIRYPQARALQVKAEKALKPAPKEPPAPKKPMTTAGASGDPILEWARAYEGLSFDRGGLRWIRQGAIPWFRQRERRIRAVAWHRGVSAAEAPGGIEGVYWGFPVAGPEKGC